MKVLRRTLAALLALVLLSGMVVEGVAASLCPPGMDGHPSAAAATAEHQEMHHQAPSQQDEEPESSRSSTPPCAPGMAGAGSSCLAVPLPASASAVNPVLPVAVLPLIFAEQTHDRLVVSPHFRPPRP